MIKNINPRIVTRLLKAGRNTLSGYTQQPQNYVPGGTTPSQCRQFSSIIVSNHQDIVPMIRGLSYLTIQCADRPSNLLAMKNTKPQTNIVPARTFYAKNSRVRYLDFRYRFPTGHFRSHLLIIRKQKMKKHQKRKWRKKFKCAIAKKRLKREIAKEKAFRVELLTMIRRAEQFDPKDYALRKLHEKNSVPREKTRKERFEEIKELVRINRYQTDYIKPKHRRLDDHGLIQQTYQTFATD